MAETFAYQGIIYVRPCGRGVILVDDKRQRQFDDDVLPEGFYVAEIAVRTATEAEAEDAELRLRNG